MILSPIGLSLRPKLAALLIQSRTVRPIIKYGKEKFEISIDVHQFQKDELRVKARPEYVVIHGKQERKTKNGFVIRQFIRKFKLPPGCSPEDMKSVLSKDGILTITANKQTCEINLPCEQAIPISYSGEERDVDDASFIEADTTKDPCAMFKNVPDDKKHTIKSPDDKKGDEKK